MLICYAVVANTSPLDLALKPFQLLVGVQNASSFSNYSPVIGLLHCLVRTFDYICGLLFLVLADSFHPPADILYALKLWVIFLIVFGGP